MQFIFVFMPFLADVFFVFVYSVQTLVRTPLGAVCCNVSCFHTAPANSGVTLVTFSLQSSSRVGFPKPPFVLVRLADEVPEDVINSLHIFRTITSSDVADQRCIRRTSVRRVSLIVFPDDQMPSFKSFLTLYMLDHPQWFVCCRPV